MKGLANAEDWKPRLADLSGRSEETVTETTRQLSETGKWIFLSLALVPLGLGFLDFDLIDKAFGATPSDLARLTFVLSLAFTAAPMLVVAGFYVWWRGWKEAYGRDGKTFLFKRKFWSEHDEGHKNQSILALLTNQSTERTENRTRISPEPTAIEFRMVFRALLKSLQKHEKRLVIVIDNLDRLAEADAMQLWATIRSLFLGGEASIETDSGLRAPAIILPIDERAIERMFQVAHPDQAEVLAAAFIDKTFDITFHVNEPVMSDWRAYLNSKLLEAFGASATPVRVYWATKIAEEKLAKDNKDGKITPRKLIKLVNSTAALIAQWGDDIDFVAMIFYVLHRHAISRDVVAFVRNDWPSVAAAASDWRRQIVALHFGVAPAKAFQVLLHEPLRVAIGENDREEFEKLIQVQGAWAIMEEIVDNPPANAAGLAAEASFVANAALLIAITPQADEIRAKRVLHRLSSIWVEASDIGLMRADFAEFITSLSSSLTANTVVRFLTASVQKLGEAMSKSSVDETTTTAFLRAVEALEKVANGHDVSLPATPLTFDAKTLFAVLKDLPASHRRHVRTDKSTAEIGAALRDSLADENSSSNVPGALRALAVDETIGFKDKGKIDWDSVANAAGAIVQANSLDHHATGPAIDVLGLLHTANQTAKDLVASNFDQGRLKVLLDEADSQKETVSLADIAALMLLRGSDFAGPNGKTWDQVLQDQPDFVSNVDAALSWYHPDQRATVALNAKKNCSSFIPVIRGLAKLNVATEASADITAAYLLPNLQSLVKDLGDDLLNKCIADVSKREDFWPAIGKLKAGPTYDDTVQRLSKVEEVDRDRLIADIRARLEGADQGAWSSAVKQGSPPYALAQIYRADFGQTSPWDSLTPALTESRSDLLQTDRETRERWFALAALISKSARATMLRSLRDSLLAGNDVAELDSLIATGGEMLMEVGKFADEADKTARHVLLPLVRSELGRTVLQSQASFFESVVAKSEQETQYAIVETMDAVAEADYELGKRIAELKAALGLS